MYLMALSYLPPAYKVTHYISINEGHIIGASLSEPHIDEFAVEFLYIYILYISRASCRKSLPTLILRVLASFVNSKTIHKLLYSTQREGTNCLATARTETTRGLTYSMVGTIGATTWQKGFICRCHYLCCHSQWKSLVTWTPYSIVLCICRFCGLYVYSVYSVARGCSMLNHILMTVMQLMLRQIQHQAMRNSIGVSPSSVVCSIYSSFHDRARGCSSFSSAATIQPLNCTLILDIHC